MSAGEVKVVPSFNFIEHRSDYTVAQVKMDSDEQTCLEVTCLVFYRWKKALNDMNVDENVPSGNFLYI